MLLAAYCRLYSPKSIIIIKGQLQGLRSQLVVGTNPMEWLLSDITNTVFQQRYSALLLFKKSILCLSFIRANALLYIIMIVLVFILSQIQEDITF